MHPPFDPQHAAWPAARARWPAWCIVAAVALSSAVPLLLLEREPLCSLFFDDAFYYFQVARNAAAGRGWTFDGLHATNGFHPLWMFVLVPLFSVVPGEVLPLRAVGLLEAGLIALGCVGIFRLLRGRIGGGPALLAAGWMLALPGARSILRNGLESALFFALLVLVWWRWRGLSSGERSSPGAWTVFGLCCALAALARLEAVLLVPAVLFLARRRLREAPGRAAAFLAGPSVALASYLLWNRLTFGAWMPVSSLVKSHLAGALPLKSHLRGAADLPWVGHDLLLRLFGAARITAVPLSGLLLYLALVAGVGVVLWRGRGAIRAAVRGSGMDLILLGSAMIVAADVASVIDLPEWYRVPILLSTVLLAAALSTTLPRRWIRAMLLATALMILLRPGLALWKIGDGTAAYAYYRVQAADWLRENSAPGSRVGSWNAGMLGYFSHRPVVNLDGLANDLAYFRRVVRARDLCGYLRDERIDLLADQVCGGSPRPALYLRRFGCEAEDEQFVLERLFHNARTADACPGFAVWSRLRE